MFMTMYFIERKLPKGGAGAIWTLKLLYSQKTFLRLLVALFTNCNLNHYLSGCMFKYLLPWHVNPSGQDAVFSVHSVSCTGHSEGQMYRCSDNTRWGSGWEHHLLSEAVQKTEWTLEGPLRAADLLAFPSGGFDFKFCLPWASASTPLVHLTGWLSLSSRRHTPPFFQLFPQGPIWIEGPAPCSLALDCFYWLFVNGGIRNWFGKKLIWKI